MDAPFEEFERACANVFGFLRERYGFQPQEVQRLGRESFVRFHKGPRTVSIAWEPGGPPVVELFFPTAGTDYPPTPWAERNGVPYSRRFPRSPIHSTGIAGSPGSRSLRREQRREWSHPTAEAFDAYLSAAASNLARVEEVFLSGES